MIGQPQSDLAVAYAMSATWAALPHIASSTRTSSTSQPEGADVLSDLVVPDVDLVTAHVSREIHGQTDAVRLLCQTACEHVAKAAPAAPLVLVAVGQLELGKSESVKTLAHTIRSLYPSLPTISSRST